MHTRGGRKVNLDIRYTCPAQPRLVKDTDIRGRHRQQPFAPGHVAPQLQWEPPGPDVGPHGALGGGFRRHQRTEMILQVLTHSRAVDDRLNTTPLEVLGLTHTRALQ